MIENARYVAPILMEHNIIAKQNRQYLQSKCFYKVDKKISANYN